jgi:hypothetical protein
MSREVEIIIKQRVTIPEHLTLDQVKTAHEEDWDVAVGESTLYVEDDELTLWSEVYWEDPVTGEKL